ncbi:Acyl transferase domain-containing protein [Streptomyces qinglanensis]|uniref:Acyl transferase domain-containing protein n=2 Tax=Streptomyces qinglanensis TaxID=943816 RepID=A0A1H9V1R8_9ACTN|nr:type I polyketide synthase [Streptomyces qinglanensis]SES15655.1 Acyl transferase domain-containing protein [Streptomyces qinglanensis]
MTRENAPVDPIAVVGVGCRVPGADGPTQFWDNLAAGTDSVARPSARRRTAPVPAGPGLPDEGGFLDSVDEFDADFFGIPDREAAAMDPQQRLALELAWEAMEDAGVVPGALRHRPVGVFVGSLSDDYALLASRHGSAGLSHHAMTGLQRGVIANRISHHLGVRGPSLLVDTGQSSSLVSVQLACASLRAGECELALAGGVNLALAPDTQLAAARLGVLSPRGRCRVFDRDADGFVRGEGGALVVLKPLAAAVADGDRVYCVIRAAAVNHDGAGEEMAAPDPRAQGELLRAAHRAAGTDPADVQYVELHGTGTPAGDAAEADALGEVFAGRSATPLAVGSVKTNIGHLEGAAGIAGLVKTALALHHRELPASLHFTAPPDRLPLDAHGLRVQTTTADWPRPQAPLLAGVSAFGMGGTNCHVVLAAHDGDGPGPAADAVDPAEPLPFPLSARTPAALAAAARALRAHLTARPGLRRVDVAGTLATARTAHPCRALVLAHDRAALLAGLDELAGAADPVGAAVGDGAPAAASSVQECADRFLAGEQADWHAVFEQYAPVRVPLPGYPFQRRRHWPAGLGATVPEAEDAPAARPAPTRAAGAASGTQDPPLAAVLELAAGVLGAAVAPDIPFRDQGFDSMMGLELRDLVEERIGADLSVALLYDHPTPAALAEHLAGPPDQDPAAAAPATTGPTSGPAAAAADPAAPEEAADPVVVVGMGCRFPGGVENPEDLWRLLADRVDAITPPPGERGWQRMDVTGLRPGGFLTGIDRFDAEFFGISPREAAAMDPQQRLFLEVAWEAVERAGIVPGTLRATRTAVFAGATAQDYGARLHEQADAAGGFLLTGGTPSVLSGRLAYVLGLSGPALTVDTACSSSLAAVHLACRSLRTGESTLALAGGVTVMPLPGMFTEFARQGGLSADGRCRAFAAAADGTGWAEGAGAVVLERLSDARRNGHPVLAVVRGTALNSDGASNGLTAPSGLAQRQVIAAALADAGVLPHEVDAVEAHGTGTALGDPVEATALLAAYGTGRPAGRPLLLGSVKSNIGHTQAAAGLAGLIKMVLALRHGELPATLHAEEPSPHIDWASGGLELLTRAVPWPSADRPRRAGISSFGISGTNAHVVLEQPPGAEPSPPDPQQPGTRGPVVLALSGRTEQALRDQAARLHTELAARTDWRPADVAHSLLTTRTRFRQRAAVTGTGRDALLHGLTAVAGGTADPSVVLGTAAEDHRPVLVFGGQGAQWTGMGRELLDCAPHFAASIARCEQALAPHVDWSLTGVLRGDPGQPGLDRVDVVQPVLFATMVALAELWRAHGVEPAAVVGNSQGEIAAACTAGALSLDDAALIVARRSQALVALAGRGAMASVALPTDRVRALLSPWGERVSVAVRNGPGATTVSGEPDAVAEVVERCVADGVRAKLVAVDYASHSAQVAELEERLRTDLADVRPTAPRIPLMSTVDAAFVRDAALDSGYWYRNLRETVRFDEAVGALLDAGHRAFVEVSPHPVALSGIAECADEAAADVALVETLTRDEGGPERFLRSLAKADAHGLPVDWSETVRGTAVPLPTYPFQRESHWLPVPAGAGDLSAAGLESAAHPLLGAAVELADSGTLVLTGTLSVEEAPWLADHAVLDTVVLPGTGCLELVLCAARRAGCPAVTELILDQPVVLPAEGALTTQLVVAEPDAEGRRAVTVHTRADAEGAQWIRHATAVAAPDTAETPDAAAPFTAWPPPEATPVPVAGHYARLRSLGLDYGPVFRGLRSAWSRGGDLWLEVALPESPQGAPRGFGVHPALLDAALHGIWLRDGDEGTCRLPFSWTGVRLSTTAATTLRVRLASAGEDGAVSLAAWDEHGAPVLTVEALALRPVSPELLAADAGLYSPDWMRAAEPDTAPAAGAGEEAPVVLGAELPAEAPAVAVLTCPAGQDPAAAAARVLERVRAWTGDERFAASRLAVVTTGGDGELSDPGHAAVWGLMRSAQTEHPGRFLLLDTPEAAPDPARVAAALATGETQLRDREGRFETPVLRRSTAQQQPAPAPTLGGTALITGGTGGLGALVARELVTAHGVRRLLLLSRRGPHAPGATGLVAELASLGADAEAVACDAADREALARVLETVPDAYPLTTVVHAAGVLEDGLVSAMDADALHRVMRPKAAAAQALHELTAQLPSVTAFVLFSSVAGLLGTAGQANYAAANGALDALARTRHAAGLPATSIAWGLWSRRSGMTGQLDDTAVRRLAAAGIGELETDAGLRLFDAALRGSAPLVVAARLHGSGASGMLRGIAPARPRPAARREPVRSVTEELAELPAAQRRSRMVALVGAHTAAALGHGASHTVDPDTSFKALGCDSLIAVEVRNRLAAATGLRLPATVVFSHPTPAQLAGWLLGQLAPPADDAQPARPPEDAQRPAHAPAAAPDGTAAPGPTPAPAAADEPPRSEAEEITHILTDADVGELFALIDADPDPGPGEPAALDDSGALDGAVSTGRSPDGR